MEDNVNDAHGSSRLRVCGSRGQSQLMNVYTSTSSTVKLVLHRFVTDNDDDDDDDDDDDVTGYNFLLKYEGSARSTDFVLAVNNVESCV